MAYGAEVLTRNGMESVDNLLSAQLGLRVSGTSESNTWSTPTGITPDNSVGICVANDGKMHYQVNVGASSITLTKGTGYLAATTWSTNFDVYVFRVL